MDYFYDVSKEKLSQQIVISEIYIVTCRGDFYCSIFVERQALVNERVICYGALSRVAMKKCLKIN